MSHQLSKHHAWVLSLLIAFSSLLLPAATLSVQATVTDTPVPVVTDTVEEWTVGAGLLYWANNCFADEFSTFAALKRKPASGGAQRTISSIRRLGALCNTFRFPVSSGDGIYYFNESLAQLERMPLGEPFTAVTVKTLENSQFPIVPFVEAGDFLYWIGIFPNRIYRTLKDGSGVIETVADTATSPADLIVVGSTVYWTDSTGVFSKCGPPVTPCPAPLALSMRFSRAASAAAASCTNTWAVFRATTASTGWNE